MPKVSVLIPVYNREKQIRECIHSAINQKHEDLEIVVVDNSSSDNTWKICNEIAATDARVKLFRNETNIGPVRNWLRCVKEATGDYAKILFSDDLLHPDYLKETLPYLMDPDVGFVYTATGIFFDFPDNCSVNYRAHKSVSKIFTVNDYVDDIITMRGKFPISPGAALFRKFDIEQHLHSEIHTREYSDFAGHGIGSDLLLMLEVARKYRSIVSINKVLAYFRAHDQSISIKSSASKIAYNYDLILGSFLESHRTINSRYEDRIAYNLHVHKNSVEYKGKSIVNFKSGSLQEPAMIKYLRVIRYMAYLLLYKIVRQYYKCIMCRNK